MFIYYTIPYYNLFYYNYKRSYAISHVKLLRYMWSFWEDAEDFLVIPGPRNVPLLKALWSPRDGRRGVLKGSWGVLVVPFFEFAMFY